MRLSVVFAAAIAASADAAVLQKRQRGYPDVGECGLDAFEGHTSEAVFFCSAVLRSGTATETITRGGTTTVTTTKKVTTTVYPPTSSKRPTPTPTPTPTPKPTPTPTPSPSPKPTPSPSPKPSSSPVPPKPSSSSPKPPPVPSSSPKPVSSTPVPRPSSTIVTVPSPSPTAAPGCGIVAYVKSTPAYYFESSGTKNTFAACQALCKADAKCQSFGYGEANCMLFDLPAADNTNYNPMSPYTFYDVSCPKELPVRKRQIDIELPLPGGINVSLDLNNREISSACSCLITKGPASTTVTRTATAGVTKTATATSTVTRTAGGDAAVAGDEEVEQPVEPEVV